MNYTRKQYLEFAQITLGLAILLVFSRAFVSDSPVIELFHNLTWAVSLGSFALSRGRHPAWGLLGFAFGGLGFISLFFLKTLPLTESNEE